MSWSTLSHGACPPAWVQLSSVTTSVDIGVDFHWLLRQQYPMRICDDRPATLVSLFAEGAP